MYEGKDVILELDGNDDEIASNMYGLTLVKRTTNSDEGYYLYNGHGDVVGIIDDANAVLNTYEYDAFGVITNESETIDNPFRYAGYYYDVETENYYLMSRYYNPVIARFITEDTYRGELDDPLSLNRYVYVLNNPLIYYDPFGYSALEVFDWVVLRGWGLLEGGAELATDAVTGVCNFAGTVRDTVYDELWFTASSFQYMTGMIDEDQYLNDLEIIEGNLKKSLSKTAEIPVNMVTGTVENLAYTLNPKNFVNYLTTDDYDEIKTYSKSAIQTGLTLYGGYKMASGIISNTSITYNPGAAVVTPEGMTYSTLGSISISITDTAALNQALIEGAKTIGISSTAGSSSGSSNSNNSRKQNPSKNKSEVWKELDNVKNSKLKSSGSGSNKQYYDWDYTHNDIEVYNSRGQHLGSMDPTTGKMYKSAKGYTIELP